MLQSGLCSITFRDLTVDEIIRLCEKAGIDGIEWGGDVHVPPGDTRVAESVKAKTEEAGLSVCSYGSYYRCDAESGDFEPVLNACQALGAPVLRVWAGRKGSADASSGDRDEVVRRIREAVVAAREKDIDIALEYHGGTLTDAQSSAHLLLEEVGMPELKLYWQPRTAGAGFESDLAELKAALPHLSHLHCFHWGPTGSQDKRPLQEGRKDWHAYLQTVRETGEDRFVILEFVKNNDPDQFLQDAEVLNALLTEKTL